MIVLVSVVCAIFLYGCASDDTAVSDQPWSKEVIIEFRADSGEFERQQFYDIYHLDFLAQYDADTVRVEILTGEPIDEFIDRAGRDPLVDSIKPAPDTFNQ